MNSDRTNPVILQGINTKVLQAVSMELGKALSKPIPVPMTKLQLVTTISNKRISRTNLLQRGVIRLITKCAYSSPVL